MPQCPFRVRRPAATTPPAAPAPCPAPKSAIAALIICLGCLGSAPLWAGAAAPSGIQLTRVITTGQAPHQIAFSPDGRTAYIAAAGADRIDLIDTTDLTWRSALPAAGTPLGIAVDHNGNLLTSRFRGAALTPLDPHGRAGDDISIGAAPSLFTPFTSDVHGPLWLISSEQAHQLSIVAAQPWRVLSVFATGQRPFPGAATGDGRLFVPNYADGTVSVFDLDSDRTLKTITVGDRPSGGSLLPGGHTYAVAVRGENRLALIDTKTLTVSGEIRAGIGASPFSVAVDPQRQLAFVNNTGSHDISVIDLHSRHVIQRLNSGEIPIVMALQPDGRRLWVACEGTHDVHIYTLPDRTDTTAHAAADDSHANRNNSTHSNRTDHHETPPMNTPIQAAAIQEIRQLHYFFQEWFSGRLEHSETAFARFRDVMAPDLGFIAPSATQVPREALIQRLWQAHGQDTGHHLRIWTENESVRQLGPETWLGIYEEHQIRDDAKSIRLSSVVFSTADNLPNGLIWRHVHETWHTLADKAD